MTTWIVMALVSLLFLGPLLWRARRDRLEDRALALQADIQAAVNRHLGGESLVAVRVVAGAQRGMGTVEIFVPAGWDSVLEDVWPVVLKRVPAGYALVFRPSLAPTHPVDPDPVRRAA
jgi:uncharacterized protein YbdZ (MbtH family)